MSTTSQSAIPHLRYHSDAYRFIFEALNHTQKRLDRPATEDYEDERAHITGRELMLGVKDLALDRYGLLARNVFAHWGVRSTGDFGRIVFEMIERGEMRKTERDQLSDFLDVYDFDQALDKDYVIPVQK